MPRSLLVHNYTLITKLRFLMTGKYNPNNGFTANDASFYKNKICLAALHVAVSFQLIVLAIILYL